MRTIIAITALALGACAIGPHLVTSPVPSNTSAGAPLWFVKNGQTVMYCDGASVSCRPADFK